MKTFRYPLIFLLLSIFTSLSPRHDLRIITEQIKPDIIGGSLGTLGRPVLFSKLPLIFKLKPLENLSNVKITLSFPPGMDFGIPEVSQQPFTSLRQETSLQVDLDYLERNFECPIIVPIMINNGSENKVTAYVEAIVNNSALVDHSYYLYLDPSRGTFSNSPSNSKASSNDIAPPYKQVPQKNTKQEDTSESTSYFPEQDSQPIENSDFFLPALKAEFISSITISGYWHYELEDNTQKPIRQSLVQIFESGILWDSKLGETYTSDKGYYSVTLDFTGKKTYI